MTEGKHLLTSNSSSNWQLLVGWKKGKVGLRLHYCGQRDLPFYLTEFPLIVSIIFFLSSFYLPMEGLPTRSVFWTFHAILGYYKHFSAARNHFHAAWKCLRKLLLSTCWGCSRATFTHSSWTPGRAPSLQQATAIPWARQGEGPGTGSCPRNKLNREEETLKHLGEHPGSQDTLSVWNSQYKLCKAEVRFRNWDPAKT